ncbi:MAG: HIT family protein [Rickettsiales bacterium]|nr:HIT family protein [Rickettsiales bacterium]
MADKCFFCKFEKGLINENKILDGKLAYIIADGHPVTQHHCLIVPKRHFASFFEITNEELLEINELIKVRKDQILKLDPTVSGFNIGINIGEAAGQTVFHLHVHLIPRRIGDVEHPRGGVRGVIPEKQSY